MKSSNTASLVGISAALVLISACLLFTQAVEAKSKRYTNTAEYCEGKQPNGAPNPCAALVYAVGTSNYYVNKVDVKARGTQQWDSNPVCADFSDNNTMDLRASEYGVFIVPAPCSYKLEIHIGGGDKKKQDVFMTPGCQLVLISEGTTLNNNTPKVDSVKWTDEAKAAFDAQGIAYDNNVVSDAQYHAARGNNIQHFCNKDDKADKNPNS